ncbi:hypothetical protein CRV15_30750 (plasmid) [Streptomyces clavuligerus]|nr:hypothetical protein [Streptomyces clavuligerus]MBY6307473.1 hypothetical protein [Streptomyces clavuligerus]QCS09968.1 hypothetical protein CRV15_30750 [Streptomyces clavuligerus]QPJ98493.1 hypothetical protein GE265_33685 [Streptomyces clavuligerus]
MVYALAAAVCYGTASVLQAAAARDAEPGSGAGVDPVLLVHALRNRGYVLGLALDTLGFLLQVVALRSIPLYAVSAALAASLAVTAVVATRLLALRLSGAEWGAVVTVCAGLTMVGLASGAAGSGAGPAALRGCLIGAALVLLLAGVLANRLPERGRALLLGTGAGVGFGIVAVAVRLIDSFALPGLLADPALYAVVLGGVTGFLLLTSAYRYGPVTVATAGMVLAETLGPALVGLEWLGDRPRDGLQWLAFVGFGAAVTGALALARFGEPATGRRPPGGPGGLSRGRRG